MNQPDAKAEQEQPEIVKDLELTDNEAEETKAGSDLHLTMKHVFITSMGNSK